MPQTDPKQTDYVEPGSPRHASLLGLRKATADDDKSLVYKGWALKDLTQWGPNARPEFLRAQLTQKVAELETPPSVPEGTPPMWTPQQPKL